MHDHLPLNYDLISPAKIVFGWGRRREAGTLAASLGKRAFWVLGSRTLRNNGTLAELQEQLRTAGVASVDLADVSGEPEVKQVDGAAKVLREHRPGAGDMVIGLGGGSAIDLAKAVAGVAMEEASVVDYLEGVGRGLSVSARALPVLAMPTTGGTGAEATKNAVISCYEPLFKKSLRSERLLPRIVIVDPQLSVSVSPATTAATGMDAVTQLIESYVSCRAQPVPRALCLEGIEGALAALEAAFADGSTRWAREKLAHAALLSGMALANSGLGLAHGVAAALGVHCRVPHGLACAVMLPSALRVNRQVKEADLACLARAVLGRNFASDAAACDALLAEVERLCHALGIARRLSELGVTAKNLPQLVVASRGNSMSGNPRQINDDELLRLLEELL